MNKRVCALFFLLCLSFGVLFVKMAELCGGNVSDVAASKNTVGVTVASSRGNIYDCKMRPLVNCDTVLKAAIKPCEESLSSIRVIVPESEIPSVYSTLSQGKIAVCASNAVFDEKNIKTAKTVVRYGENSLAPHITGYIDGDGNGVSGIEKCYNDILLSYSGTLKARCGAAASGKLLEGAEITFLKEGYMSAGGVELTVDRDIQKLCESALGKFDIDSGAVVVLDSATSEIRAMASTPSFDRNAPEKSLNDSSSPFLNRAITPYSVGSVFKAVVACAALENGISTSYSIVCNGKYDLNGEISFGCFKKTGHGNMNMYSAMAESCNPYFISLALKTGKENICAMGENLGLGQKIELADGWETKSGIMPSADSLISEADLCNLAFGQGKLLASPLQMSAVYAAVANNGVYRAPSLMKAVTDENGKEIKRAELPVPRRVMSVDTAKTVTELLRETVVSGSGKRAETEYFDAAGKTATAQSGWFDENGNEVTHSWFCGFFPYDSPRYVITVFKENGAGGALDCAPVFKYIADGIKR